MSKLISFLCAVAVAVSIPAATFAANESEDTTTTEEVAVTVDEASEQAVEEDVDEADASIDDEVTDETATDEALVGENSDADAETNAESLTFTDVADDAYYAEAVKYCAEKELFNGVGDNRFAPDEEMSRGMFATVFGRLQNADLTNVQLTYTDVKTDAYYAPYIAWATEKGIMEGYGDGLFGPDDSITREQAAKMLYSYAKVLRINVVADDAVYPDSESVSDWAKDPVAANTILGYLLVDENGNINPTAPITRADACYAVATTVKLIEIIVNAEEKINGGSETVEEADKDNATSDTDTSDTTDDAAVAPDDTSADYEENSDEEITVDIEESEKEGTEILE